jgi:undecaprenyl-diphosphatase
VLRGLDLKILLFLNHWLAHSVFAQTSERLLEDIPAILAPVVVVLWWTMRPESDALRTRALSLLVAQPVTYVITTLLQHLNHRPRPIISVPLEYFDAKLFHSSRQYFSHGGSFPSDHEALLFLLAAFVFSVNRKLGVLCAVFGVFYAALRCGIGYHWPSDMLGGAIIAVAIAALFLRFERDFVVVYEYAKRIPPAWASSLTCLAFVYLADQFGEFGHSRELVQTVFHQSLFH